MEINIQDIESIVRREVVLKVEQELQKEISRVKEKSKMYGHIYKEMRDINGAIVVHTISCMYFFFSGLICMIIGAIILKIAPEQKLSIDLSNLLRDPEHIITSIVANGLIFPLMKVLGILFSVAGATMLFIALIFLYTPCMMRKSSPKNRNNWMKWEFKLFSFWKIIKIMIFEDQ